MECAAIGCDKNQKRITYDSPLCYAHWPEFDAFEIEECGRCHFFSFIPEGDQCFDCYRYRHNGKDVRDIVIHNHAPIEVELRSLYILQLDGGDFYIGQTYDLEARLVEHQQGRTVSTKGKHPELVWFEYRVGDKQGLLDDEGKFTALTRTESGRREILQTILDWQRPLLNVKFLNRVRSVVSPDLPLVKP